MPDPGGRERYEAIRRRWPELFTNLADAAYEILLESSWVSAAEAAEGVRLAGSGLPRAWASTGVVYEDPYLLVIRDAVRRPDGAVGTYVRTLPASGAAGVAVLPVMDDQIVLVRHFRHATRAWHLEVPRGFGESHVPATDQARQELHEEIGARPDALIELGRLHSNNGIASDCVDLFLAKIHEVGSPEIGEGISGIEFYPPGQVAGLICTGAITDSFTIAAFTRAELRGLLGRRLTVA